jgi:hypothetical protein
MPQNDRFGRFTTTFMILLTLGLVFYLLFGVTPAKGQSAARGFDQTAMDATLAIYATHYDSKHVLQSQFVCSSFVVGEDPDGKGITILSAGHCVDDQPSDWKFAVADTLGATLQPLTVLSARYVDDTSDDDTVLFHLATTKKYPVLVLGDESEAAIGDETLNPNFTYGLAKQLSRGRIASGAINSPVAFPNTIGGFILDEFAGVGASGSPVISVTSHKVIGIVIAEVDHDGMIAEPTSGVRKSIARRNDFKKLHQLHLPSLFGDIENEQ